MNAKISLLIILTFIATFGYAQTEEQSLASFDRIIASQFVRVVLEKGENQSIRFDYSGINPEEVNFKVKRKKLRIYLTDARLIEKNKKVRVNGYTHRISRYNGHITAYITYKDLRGIKILGEEGLTCNGAINAPKFKLKVYGENDVTLASLQTNKFRAAIFGENNIEIKSGTTGHQLYRLFGENKIDTEHLESNTTTSRIFGEGRLTVNANDELKITAFGAPEIRLTGSAHVSKNLVLGEVDIKVRR